jgi:hypothetical protein
MLGTDAAMRDGMERKRILVATGIVVGTAVLHRALLLVLHYDDLDRLIVANGVWYTYQHLPREMLHDHLADAMLLLQQTPPASNLILGLVLKACSWPIGVGRTMITLQSLVSISTAALLVRVLAMLYPGRVLLWTVVGLLFAISTDLVVLEYNNLGQIIYEPLVMLETLGLLAALLALRRDGRTVWALVAGIVMGLLVLTRATWYLFPIACLAFVALLAPARRLVAVAACLVPILVLQGGWAVKNYLVYGTWSATTSTWGGMHARAGMRAGGVEDEFLRARAEWAATDPPSPPSDQRQIWLREAEVVRRFGLDNPMMNTLGFHLAVAEDQRAFFRFVRTHPGTMLRKWWGAYRIFWQPIANYGTMFVDLFSVSNRIVDPFAFGTIVDQLARGKLPDTEYLGSGTHPWTSLDPKDHVAPWRVTPTTFYTFRWTDPFTLMLAIVGVHLLAPLLGVVWLVGRSGLSRVAAALDPLRMTALLVGITLYGYLAGLVNLVETHENMRYRLEVHPIIWIITLIAISELARTVRRREHPSWSS